MTTNTPRPLEERAEEAWKKYRRKAGFGAPGGACCQTEYTNAQREKAAKQAMLLIKSKLQSAIEEAPNGK